jgi:Spy/CpxP family protein refolding chaperone
MRTLRITLALAVALLIALPAAAQEKKARKGGARKLSPTAQLMLRIGRLREALEQVDLTAEQQEQLEKIREELGPKMKESFGKMRDILTEEQRSTVEESMRKAREAGKEGRELVLAVESSIELTDEQKEKLAKVVVEMRPLHRQMMKKVMGILTPEQQEKVKEKMAPRVRKQGKEGEKKESQ